MLTIGILGLNQKKAAELYVEIVKQTTTPERPDDQDHPPAINVSLPFKTPEEIISGGKLLKELGAKFIVVPNHLSQELIEKLEIQFNLPVLCLGNDEKIKNLASKVIDKAFSDNTKDVKNGGFSFAKSPEYVPETLTEFISNISKRKKIVGAICGAGPLAGAVYCQKLAEAGVPYIMLSDTTAPYKNAAVMGTGPDFLGDYIRDFRLLDPYVDYHTVACNTAHVYKDTFQTLATKPILDIRVANAVFAKLQCVNKQDKRIVLFATPATIDKRLYHSILTDIGFNVVEPEEDELKQIWKSICEVKAQSGDPKALILKLAEGVRERYGDDIPVLLGCTELNVPFTEEELEKYNLISTTHGLAFYAGSFIQHPDIKLPTNEKEVKSFSNTKLKNGFLDKLTTYANKFFSKLKKNIDSEHHSYNSSSSEEEKDGSDMSDNEAGRPRTNSYSNYDIKAYKDEKGHIRIYFQHKEGILHSDKQRRKLLVHFKEIFDKDYESSRVHLNSGYISFTHKIKFEEKSTLESWLQGRNISIENGKQNNKMELSI
jgi:aspartate/glutamate racemase